MENRKRIKSPMADERAAQRLQSTRHPSVKFMSSVDGIISRIKGKKTLVTVEVVRKELYRLGVLPNIRPTAEYVVKVGCYPSFFSPGVLQSYFRVLEKFGIEFTILEDEVCCGFVAQEQALVNEDWEALERAQKAAKGFMKVNVDAARQKGAKAMLHFCRWCNYIYEWANMEGAFDKEGQRIRHLSLMTPVFERLDKVKLKLDKPTVIGYYRGCDDRPRALFPDVKIDWQPYRKALEHIENAEIIDLRSSSKECCMLVSENVLENARAKNIDVIVSPCYACSNYLIRASKGTMPVKFFPVILDEASK